MSQESEKGSLTNADHLYDLNASLAALEATITESAKNYERRLGKLERQYERSMVDKQQDSGITGSLAVILKAGGYILAGILASKGIDISGVFKQ